MILSSCSTCPPTIDQKEWRCQLSKVDHYSKGETERFFVRSMNFRLNIEDRSRYLKDIFTSLLDLSWLWILILFVICFALSWLLFAVLWFLIMYVHDDFSPQFLNGTALNHRPCVYGIRSFTGTILFSIETQQTIGYGTRAISEQCSSAILLLIVQSCFGLLIQALWVGLVYTRLSRPKKRRQTLLWSRQAIICLRDGLLTLQVRLGDMRLRSTLVEAHIRMYFLSRRETKEKERIPIDLLDMNVGYDAGKDRLFLHWPVIIEHKIDHQSPLYAMNKNDIHQGQFEIFLVLEGSIESTGMSTQAKTSYLPSEILWGSRFETMIDFTSDNDYIVDYAKFHQTTVDMCTPTCSAQELDQQTTEH